MTEKESPTIIKVNNTNPWCLIGLGLACTKNWINKGHKITRIRLERENKITNNHLFYCSMIESEVFIMEVMIETCCGIDVHQKSIV